MTAGNAKTPPGPVAGPGGDDLTPEQIEALGKAFAAIGEAVSKWVAAAWEACQPFLRALEKLAEDPAVQAEMRHRELLRKARDGG